MFFCHLFCFFVVVLSFLLHIFSLCSSAESIKRGTRETKKKQTLQTKKLELKNKTKDSPVKCEDQKKKSVQKCMVVSFFLLLPFPKFSKSPFSFFSFPSPWNVCHGTMVLVWNKSTGKKKRNPLNPVLIIFFPLFCLWLFTLKETKRVFYIPPPFSRTPSSRFILMFFSGIENTIKN